MRNSKASSSFGVLGHDAFRIIKICVLGISMASVPLFVKPAFMGTYEFLSMAIPQVRETLSLWLTPTFLYLILNCIIIAIAANSGVGIFNFKGSSHHEEKEKESQFKPKSNINPIVHENNEKICVDHENNEKISAVHEKNEKICVVHEKIGAEDKRSQTTSSMALGIVSSEAVCAAESLEDTWKFITSRRPPPARQLRKSDTWETHSSRAQPLVLESASYSKFGKSETWNSGRNLDREIVGAEMLKKEPSLGQDELNDRVEAFIAKVNHDMKLQREKSLLSYKEMVNRGSG